MHSCQESNTQPETLLGKPCTLTGAAASQFGELISNSGSEYMTLLTLAERLDKLEEEDVIFAREEWTPESEAAVFRLTEDYMVPEEPKRLGLKCFLEVHIALDVLDGFILEKPHATTRQKCERLIEYAIHDA